MVKLDQVSLEIGKLKASVKGLNIHIEEHSERIMVKLDKIEEKVDEINGTSKSNTSRIKNLEDNRWTLRKASMFIGIVATLITMLMTLVVFIPMTDALEGCTQKELAINEECLITVWAWNQTDGSFITEKIIEINITNESGLSEASSLMNNNSNGLHNFTFTGSSTSGYKNCIITAAGGTYFEPHDCSFVVNESTQELIKNINESIVTNITLEHGEGLYNSSNATVNVNASAIANETWSFPSGQEGLNMLNLIVEIFLTLIGGAF